MNREIVMKLEARRLAVPRRWAALIGIVLGLSMDLSLIGSENVPHPRFGEWAEVPVPGQLIAGLIYEESEAYHAWAHGQRFNITTRLEGENYGVDINQGYVALQYGIAPRWAADLSLGGTTLAWRSFNDAVVHSTTGLMDWALGVRYQVFNESNSSSSWMPTLTFRAGGVLPGTYNRSIAFAPGVRSAAIEPELIVRKHFGWPGLGAFGDVLYRWNRTTQNDQYITDIGLFQQIKGWELDLGYRHLQTLSGGDIVVTQNEAILYPRDVRENNDAIDAGFSYTTSKRRLRYAFHARKVIDGNNTDSKFWVGGSLEMPFDLPWGKAER
jgi:hypothetical protein